MSVPVVLGGIKKADVLLLIERDVSSVTIVTKNSTCSQDLTKEVYSFLKSKACPPAKKKFKSMPTNIYIIPHRLCTKGYLQFKLQQEDK